MIDIINDLQKILEFNLLNVNLPGIKNYFDEPTQVSGVLNRRWFCMLWGSILNLKGLGKTSLSNILLGIETHYAYWKLRV